MLNNCAITILLHGTYTLLLVKKITLTFALLYTAFTAQAAISTITSFADTDTLGTLRYAINRQAAYDVYTFAYSGTVTLTSSLPTITARDITINTSTYDVAIDGAGAYRIFEITSATVNLSKLTLKNAYSSGNGAALYNSAANLRINLTGLLTFEDNISALGGGAISTFGDLTIVGDTLFKGNSASNSGGAINASNALTLSGAATFKGNSTSNNGGAINSNKGFSISDTAIFGGTGVNEGNTAEYSGGAIYLGNSANTLTFDSDVSFIRNKTTNSSYGTGGAIYFSANSGTNTINNTGVATFKGNSSNSGGAIYSNSNLTITGDATFGGSGANEGNTASTSGGAIYLDTSANTLTFGSTASFINNKVTTASNNGGAIYFESTSGTNTIDNSGLLTFKGNTAANSGGAIYSNSNLTITGDATFGGTGAGEGNTAGNYGGAIYMTSGAKTLTFGNTVDFINNKTTSTSLGYGGAIYFDSTSLNKIANTGLLTFTGNETGYAGGAIYSLGALEITGAVRFGDTGTNEGNSTANYGGAIFMTSGARTLTFGGTADFINNKATSTSLGYGGAIYFVSTSGTKVANTGLLTFTGNTAGSRGGAIYSMGALEITGAVTFGGTSTNEGNSTAYYGGAIYMGNNANALTFGSTADFINNKTTSISLNHGGGAIHFASTSGTNTINNTGLLSFTGNTAGIYGGAVYSLRNLTISGATSFTGNTAGYGGAVSLDIDANTLTFGSTASFINNKTTPAFGSGGAIYFAQNDANTINNTGLLTFTGNTAGFGGGAIYSNGDLGIIGAATFGGTGTNEGNSAACGGAVYLGIFANTLTFSGTTSFINNKATSASGKGGAIYFTSTGSNTINSRLLTFTGNLASNSGGAIYSNGSVFALYANIGNISFSGNKMGVDFEATDPSLTGTANSIYLNNASTVYLAAASGKTITLSDPIKATASTTHTVHINKYQTGTVTNGTVIFSGTNYAENSDHVKTDIKADTIVHGGTFSVTQKAQYGTVDSTLAVNSGAVLMGSGYILGATTLLSGSTLAAGEGVGTLTFDNLSINGGSILEIESGDLINVLGTLDLSGASGINKILIDLINFEATVVDYKIMSMADYAFGDTNLNEFFDFQGKFIGDIYALNDAVYLNGTVIPEPSTYAAILGLLALAFVIYRRRKA